MARRAFRRNPDDVLEFDPPEWEGQNSESDAWVQERKGEATPRIVNHGFWEWVDDQLVVGHPAVHPARNPLLRR